ncbi:hypothetical protein [Streptomyces sp. HCCB10043]|uniref:hypothetical protein n=1 Tax=Streptomyces sp. HCCB10043 TaxID=1396518 RepID=UPI0001AF256A|nr:hypothetical protein [Streptomyces sp. HCCB10043]
MLGRGPVLRHRAEAVQADRPTLKFCRPEDHLAVPEREAGMSEDALPPDYQQIMSIVRKAGGPARVKDVGIELGLDVEVKGRLEPLRGKLTKLSGRGRLRKLPDGRFQIIP